MIKQKIVLRNEVYDVYSSEKQERMKVYFKLNEKFQICATQCKLVSDDQNCDKQCESVYNDYAAQLKHRYEGEKAALIDAEVQGLPSFDRFKRKDRGWCYAIFGYNFSELMGTPDQRQNTSPDSRQNTNM